MGSSSYKALTNDLVDQNTIISNTNLYKRYDHRKALIWPEAVYSPQDGTSLLDIKIEGNGEYVLRGDICSPTQYNVSVNKTMNNFMGYTSYNGRKVYYIGSDSYFDYSNINYSGKWHCGGDGEEIKHTITDQGKKTVINLVKKAINP
jgi:hypothetical protein